jgi:CheY-like chemotaxis protein/HPt (histidine-containing phosphotransfer) domain-containing protein
LIVFALMTLDVKPARILVVDDDDVSREVIALLLESAGYEVNTAGSGDAALLLLSAGMEGRPAVVLTDLQMPGIAGSELALRLRAACGTGTVLLAMSGSEPDGAVRREFDGFLLKPFTTEALVTAISGGTGVVADGIDRDIAVLDQGVYRKLAGAMGPERLEQLYSLCLSDAEMRVARMRQAASGDDDAAYKREAHAVKGSCGMVGAMELQTLAMSMEEKGLGNANHVASLDEFMLACERLRRILIAHASEEKHPEVQGEDAL